MSQTIKPYQKSNPYRCSVYRTADFAATVAAWAGVPFDNEDGDPSAMHDNATNNQRINILKSGWYAFGGVLRFASVTTGGLRVARYNSSGTQLRGGVMDFVTSQRNICTVSGEMYLNQGDYLVLQYYTSVANTITHNSSGGDAPANTRFYVRLVEE